MQRITQRILPPILFLSLLTPLAALFAWHPEAIPQIRTDRALPWDIPLIIGLVVLIGARIQFKKENAEIMTFSEPRNLVTTGFFHYSRNPMYLGFLLLLVAAAMFVNQLCAFLAPLAFFIAANWWYIPYEEGEAERIFGDKYWRYVFKTRRWI